MLKWESVKTRGVICYFSTPEAYAGRIKAKRLKVKIPKFKNKPKNLKKIALFALLIVQLSQSPLPLLPLPIELRILLIHGSQQGKPCFSKTLIPPFPLFPLFSLFFSDFLMN